MQIAIIGRHARQYRDKHLNKFIPLAHLIFCIRWRSRVEITSKQISKSSNRQKAWVNFSWVVSSCIMLSSLLKLILGPGYFAIIAILSTDIFLAINLLHNYKHLQN